MNLSDWGPEERVAHDGVAGGMSRLSAATAGPPTADEPIAMDPIGDVARPR